MTIVSGRTARLRAWPILALLMVVAALTLAACGGGGGAATDQPSASEVGSRGSTADAAPPGSIASAETTEEDEGGPAALVAVVGVAPSTVTLGADFVAIEITVRNLDPGLPTVVDVEGHAFHTGLPANFRDPSRVDENTIRVLVFLVGPGSDERTGLPPGQWDITVRNDEQAATLAGALTVKAPETAAAPRFELSGRIVSVFAARDTMIPTVVPGYRERLTLTLDYGAGTVFGAFTQSTDEVLVERSETDGQVTELFVRLDQTTIAIGPAVVLPPGRVEFQAPIAGVGQLSVRATFSGGPARDPIEETIVLTQTGWLSIERWDAEREVLIGILIVEEVPGESELFVLGASTIEYRVEFDFSAEQ